jgi:shikimate kinase
MNNKKNLILCGFMGTGKSVVGKAVSAALGFDFVDTDSLIESRCGKTIADIFREDSEEYFRDLEKEILFHLRERNSVIAAGGGMIIDRENYKWLSGLGLMILLTASVDTICRRIGNDNSRPLLSGENLKGTVQKLLSQRQPVYNRIEYRINTDRMDVSDVSDAVIRIYRENA